ncbi:MAG: glutamate--tRNA ligase [Candidatus Staskawiczbacteria bacterium]|nr:glutamate--tRNA ligase [Candidatus Staskawiczbacteria bacterium]
MKTKNTKVKKIRVRIAPSPTGPLHIGTARSALFNYLFAQKSKGIFVLRVEDTDLERSDLKWTQDIIEGLKWLGIEWQEGPDIDGKYGPYKQSQRMDIYEKYLKKLLEEDKAYYCFCPEDELEAMRQEQMARGESPHYNGKCANLSKKESEKFLAERKSFVIRFKIKNKKVKFEDLIRGKVEFNTGLFGDIVIAKNLKAPFLYNFTVVVDDYEMQISHVIRGEDHISNTPKQILLQEALDFYRPAYAHLPLILAPDRTKLSKRHGAFSIAEYKEQGYLPEALINFMVHLGWNSGTEKEIFVLSSLIKEFSLERVQKSGAIFNIKKLDFINSFYIREKTAEKLTELCLSYLISARLIKERSGVYEILETKEEVLLATLQKIIKAYRLRLKKLSEIAELTSFFFKGKLDYEKELLRWQQMSDLDIRDSLLASEKSLSQINPSVEEWNLDNLEEKLIKKAIDFSLVKDYPQKDRGYLLWPLRVALSGKPASASPFEIAEILGREKTIKRIKEAIKLLG